MKEENKKEASGANSAQPEIKNNNGCTCQYEPENGHSFVCPLYKEKKFGEKEESGATQHDMECKGCDGVNCKNRPKPKEASGLEWEEEFDELWSGGLKRKYGEGFVLYCNGCSGKNEEKIKSFIKDLLKKQKEEIYAELYDREKAVKIDSDLLETMVGDKIRQEEKERIKAEILAIYEKSHNNKATQDWNNGYFSALDEIIRKLKEK